MSNSAQSSISALFPSSESEDDKEVVEEPEWEEFDSISESKSGSRSPRIEPIAPVSSKEGCGTEVYMFWSLSEVAIDKLSPVDLSDSEPLVELVSKLDVFPLESKVSRSIDEPMDELDELDELDDNNGQLDPM